MTYELAIVESQRMANTHRVPYVVVRNPRYRSSPNVADQGWWVLPKTAAQGLEIRAEYLPEPCTTGCVINSQVGGDHAYCGCHCHIGTLPAIPPSRQRIAKEPQP